MITLLFKETPLKSNNPNPGKFPTKLHAEEPETNISVDSGSPPKLPPATR